VGGGAARQGAISKLECFVSLAFVRGDSTAPIGIYARLCHAFLVFIEVKRSRLRQINK